MGDERVRLSQGHTGSARIAFKIEHNHRVIIWLDNIQKMFRLQSPVRSIAEVIGAKQQSRFQDSLPVLLERGVNVGLTLRCFLDYRSNTVGLSFVEAKPRTVVMRNVDHTI